jgi:type IV pilus assembly protein PilB
MPQPLVGEFLVKSGLVEQSGLARALELQARDGGSLGRILAELGIAEEEKVSRVIATSLGLEYTVLDPEELTTDPALSLPPEFCRNRLVVPLGAQGRALRLAMADPLDQSTIQDVGFRTSRWVTAVVASETAILAALRRLHPELDESNRSFDLLASVDPSGEVETAAEEDSEIVDAAQLARDVARPPIVRLVDLVLSEAAKGGASDVHVEPQQACVQVRHRVDGMLHDVLKIPKHLQQSVISRLKIISGMDIAERRKPQDGRSRLRANDRRIDLRVSTLPTNHGEKVVIRLLDGAGSAHEMSQLGMAGDLLESFQGLLSRPQGMILVTGPTGSGKTSTLYAALNWVKSRAKNLITVEDPIEYQLAGVSQVQINPRSGVTFAAGLRSILRQDPDIVLIGEIRDQETAGIALEAAQTGRLLLSTLHTNDAPSSITRLIDLGIQPYLVASSIVGILAQRLVRRVCTACAVERAPAPETLERLGGPRAGPAEVRWMAGRGCPGCRQSGFHGRIGVHELLIVTDAIREAIHQRMADHQVRELARGAGMRTLLEDAMDKGGRGLTTLEEIMRVVPLDERRPASAGPKSRHPVRPAVDAAPGKTGPPAARPAPGTARAVAAATGGKPRVLVVEDSPTVVTVVQYFLELEGFDVLVAEDGLAGLDLAQRSQPDVVVSDLQMPGMDGIALIKALRADPRTARAGILMLTSETGIESETRVLEAGADDYLAKPVEPRRLAARVRAVLGRRGGTMAGAA